MFATDVIAAAKEHADREFPQESCGLVVNDAYVPCINIADDPEHDFRISQQEYSGPMIDNTLQAVIHSHPDGTDHPSKSDMAHQIEMGLPWGILPKGRALFWFGDQVPMPGLKGRAYRHGVTDCYALTRHWYRMKRNISLIDVPRSDEWWKAGEDMIAEHYEAAGFYQVDLPSILPGDVVLFSIPHGHIINHMGVYVGGGLILHHLPGRISTEEPVARWTKFIKKVVRYDG